VVIPVGPGTKEVFVADTIESITFNTSVSFKIILLDDSQTQIGVVIQKQFPFIDVLPTEKNYGSWCGLYISLSLAYRHALEHYQFHALLKLDTDALIIGKNPESEAIALFHSDPTIGMAGQYPTNYNGTPWDLGWPRKRILNGTRSWKSLRRPLANWILNRFYNKALRNGYSTGESVFGGAYFMSRLFLERMLHCGLLPNYKMKTLNLGEDHLFSLLVKALGFKLGDLSSGNRPFACAWKGLPDSPEQLLHNNKKIIHSTRFWDNMNEDDIRAYFRRQREQTTTSLSVNKTQLSNVHL
jgi:hypothetical protein